jgi:hypothetical protein
MILLVDRLEFGGRLTRRFFIPMMFFVLMVGLNPDETSGKLTRRRLTSQDHKRRSSLDAFGT